MGRDVDLTNQYLSALSILSDKCTGPKMHVLAAGDSPQPDPVPVSTPLTVDPSIVPSRFFPPHPPSEPPSPLSSASYESSDEDSGFPGFRVYDVPEHEPGHGVAVGDPGPSPAHEQSNPSQSASFASSSSKLPVALPLDSTQWAEILAIHLPWEPSTNNDLIRVVEDDSRRLRYFEEVERLRDYNRQAAIARRPLAPIPNLDGLKAPLASNDPITSISQISTFSPVELNAWLDHYSIPLPQGDDGQSSTRSLLATYLGIGTALLA